MLAVPLFPPLASIFQHRKEKAFIFAQKVLLAFLIIFPIFYAFRNQAYYREWFSFKEDSNKELLAIKSCIPESDRDSFIGWNILPEYYLILEMSPCYPYFVLQDFQSDKTPEFEKMVLDAFYSLDAKWILAHYPTPRIQSILDQYYSGTGEYKLKGTDYTLYHRNDSPLE